MEAERGRNWPEIWKNGTGRLWEGEDLEMMVCTKSYPLQQLLCLHSLLGLEPAKTLIPGQEAYGNLPVHTHTPSTYHSIPQAGVWDGVLQGRDPV